MRRVIAGYHGTSLETAQDLCEGRARFRRSAMGTYGAGIYFAGDEACAREYSSAFDRPAVVQVTLEFSSPVELQITDDPVCLDGCGEFLIRKIFTPIETKAYLGYLVRADRDYLDSTATRRLRDLGHDGVIATFSDGSMEIVCLSRESIVGTPCLLPEPEPAPPSIHAP